MLFSLRKGRKDNTVQVQKKLLQMKKLSFPFFHSRYEKEKTAAIKTQGNSWGKALVVWSKRSDQSMGTRSER